MENYFNKYRKNLVNEVIQLDSFITVYKNIQENRNNRLKELNFAPAFFNIISNSLYSSIILWINKLFNKNSERGFTNFINFVESNLNMFSKNEFKKRKNINDKHWLFRKNGWKELTADELQGFRKMIKDNQAIKNVSHQRDKFYAHFDKEYFFNRKDLSNDAPITWNDFSIIENLMAKIINRISIAYDGSGYQLLPVNVEDLNGILDIIKKYIDNLDSELEELKSQYKHK